MGGGGGSGGGLPGLPKVGGGSVIPKVGGSGGLRLPGGYDPFKMSATPQSMQTGGDVVSPSTPAPTGPLAKDPSTGLPDLSYFFSKNGPAGLDKRYAVGDNKYNSGQSFINQLSKRATAKGDSPWLKLQNQKIGMEVSGLRDQASIDANTGLGTAMSTLASNGGLDSGARERMASQSGIGRMNALQQVSRQGSMGRLNAGMEDERQKLDILQSLPGMQLQQAGFRSGLDQFDINNAMGLGKTAYTEGVKYKTGQEMAEAVEDAKPGAKWWEKDFGATKRGNPSIAGNEVKTPWGSGGSWGWNY